MASGSCNTAGITKPPSPLQNRIKWRFNEYTINRTNLSTLPDFTSWDQTRRLKEDGAAINDWAKRFLWKTLHCKTKNMDSKLTDTSALMKKAAGQKCQEYQPEQGSCNIINQADENIKHAQRHDPYYGD